MTEVEAAKTESVAKGVVVPRPMLAPNSALPETLMSWSVEEPVTLSAEVVAEVSDTKPPPTAFSVPPMVEDAVTARAEVVAEVTDRLPPPTALRNPTSVVEAPTDNEPDVEALPKKLLPTAFRLPLTVVEPKIKRLPALSKVRSVVVADVAEVDAIAKTYWLCEVEAARTERSA